MTILINALGIIILLGILYLLSSDKKAINKKMIAKAFIIQFILAFLLVKFPLGRAALQKVSDVVTATLSYGFEGLSFVFGPLADSGAPTGMIFGIQVLGNIIFISALVAALYYLGIIGAVVKAIGGVIGKVLGTSKVESFVAVANMFLGQTESPILVSKYLSGMTKSEIMLVLVSGMGSMSATVLMGYAGLGIPMEYLLIGGALVPLGSIIVSKIILPETEVEHEFVAKGHEHEGSKEEISIDNKGDNPNLISAISQGANDGLQMALGIGASLIAIIALVALVNGILGVVGLSLEQILSYIFAPIGALMGLPTDKILTASQLLGSKLVLNEFVAFGQLGTMLPNLDYRTGLMMAISLCGFANISSMGICISGISVFCPEKRSLLAKLAFKGMLGGFFVSVLSALVVGLIIAI
ncbi:MULTISPECIES: NupC/NupG family nucleoside CNT transporter [unclassified Romboutsia]|uniref:NupC/NupG family nucleoside CNT transporter n=1 Tax=unclassified Romboutsia TaxID=2626894 RepID=UPI001899E6C4|nr:MULTISPECIES: nucleoside transporter C-terminal domain-containing protein [unclassified Romboutsia]MDB8803714.1 nucleoside transporter C-terminal domain-containing protein [Romboutsia sp. 1001216sp1]MDB8806936.1 nucleoside transporter C-terminal domain-containing protein [Romboutsia sp. 1001216sp1]MDB8809361.1 nucleoside transporter C-terminal domain-containing protein [Romboutsia sp. 1001216sp1]MDB8815110.1 nucleoside transporter C-terminal domain-containing protein [Romboutsia sp. 1001216s